LASGDLILLNRHKTSQCLTASISWTTAINRERKKMTISEMDKTRKPNPLAASAHEAKANHKSSKDDMENNSKG